MSFHRPDGGYLGVNRSWEELFGRREREVIGHHFLEYTLEVDLQRSMDAHEALTSGRLDTVSFTKQYQHRDGRAIWADVTLTAVRDPAGRMVSAMSQIQDVTERKRRDERLFASLSLLEDAQEVGKVGTFVAWLTPDKVGVDEWSKTCMEIFGEDETTYDGTNEAFWRRVHPDDVERVREAQRAVHRSPGTRYDIRHRIIRPDGEVRWIRERAIVEQGTDGRPLRFLGVTLDITEELHAEETLRASEARFRGIFDSSGIGMATVSLDNQALDVNPALCQMLGRTAEDLVGHPLQDFMDAADVFQEEAEVKRVIDGDKAFHSFEHRLLRADGTSIWGRVHVSAVRDPEGAFEYLLAQVEDITEAKQAAEELLQARLDNEMKSRLVAVMNHEVRTPLNSILGFAELMTSDRAGPLTDKQRRYLDNIDRSGRHLLALVNDSLDLAKMEAGRMEMEVGDLEADKLLEQVNAQVLPLSEVRNLDLLVTCPPGLAILADRRRVVQILLNLLSNAIKHSPTGATIHVSGYRLDERVVLSVTDQGPGIPEEQRERIFEDYSQVGTQIEGTGLGLPVSLRLAKLMGGELWVESEVGCGSTFRVALPLARSQAAAVS
jgi:PAS domain S-box-containing protein